MQSNFMLAGFWVELCTTVRTWGPSMPADVEKSSAVISSFVRQNWCSPEIQPSNMFTGFHW